MKTKIGMLKLGDSTICPSCGSKGTIDNTLDGCNYYDDSIWYSKARQKWECYNCYMIYEEIQKNVKTKRN